MQTPALYVGAGFPTCRAPASRRDPRAWRDEAHLGARLKIVELVTAARLPTVGGIRDFAVAGGLMSYGPDQPQIIRRAADYVDSILKGAHPTDLPVEQPTKFELVINLKAAKALGLSIPFALLSAADELIE